MTAAVLTVPRAPRPTENTTGSFVLAVAMHVLLFVALWINVQWRTQPQGEVVAELWSPLPPAVEVAPPPPPPPPVVERAPEPETRDADIALKQEALKKKEEEKRAADQRKLEEARLRAEEEKRKTEELKRKAEEEKRAAAQREAIRKAEQQRMLTQAGGAPATTGSTGRSGDASYTGLLVGLIKPRIVFAVPEGTSPKIYAQVQVDLLPTGEILAVKVLKPSGLPGYDAAVERAIRRTDPFPRKRDGTIDRTITIDFYPVDAQ